MEDKQAINQQSNTMRIIAVTGGKGGIGKTTISVNLAIAMVKMRKKVLLFDADLGLANVDVMLGLAPDKTIKDFTSGACSLNEICINGPHGLKIIPSTSGIQEMADLTSTQSIEIVRSFSSLNYQFDTMIIDMASGISTQVMDMTHASKDILVIICNEPSSLMDGYAVIKILHQKYARSRFGIVVNKVNSLNEGYSVFDKFQTTVAKFMNVSLQYLGHIPLDDYVGLAARERKAVVDCFPLSKSAAAINSLCHGIDYWAEEQSLSGGIQYFFERLVQHQVIE